MGYLDDFYQYQAKARGILSTEHVLAQARSQKYLFDQMLAPWLPTDRAAAWVDIACGHGTFLVYLREAGYTRVRGIDFSTEQVTLARSTGSAVEQADAIAWLKAQATGSIQVLSAFDFIEHLTKDEMMGFLQHAQRVLQPGGRLLLRYPNGDSPLVGLTLFNDITHQWTYTSNCLNTLALMHGFRATQFRDEGTHGIRDARWLKIPLSLLARRLLRTWFQAAGHERISYWGANLWACLEK